MVGSSFLVNTDLLTFDVLVDGNYCYHKETFRLNNLKKIFHVSASNVLYSKQRLILPNY